LLFNGQIAQTAQNLSQTLQSYPAYNVVVNTFEFASGAALQYMNDMSFGLVDNFVNFENGSDVFQSGMGFGRTVSNIQGMLEIGIGLGTMAVSLSSLPSTGALTLGCAGATGGICIIPGALAVSAEVALAGVGAAIAWHGTGVLNNNHNNPLQIRGNGGGSDLPPNPEKGYYRSNKQNTSRNSDELYKNMGKPKRLEGYQAHHIVPSTSTQYEYATDARKILEEFGIDINNAGNGVMIPGKVNRELNNPYYEEAVLQALTDAKNNGADKEDILSLLQDIGSQILATGTYP
ncbi:MAG: AHH domain-containing protein, partial [Anaerolineales bacterium]|nr:AHH domain-containing protein [Anaerolineales bacterium]